MGKHDVDDFVGSKFGVDEHLTVVGFQPNIGWAPRLFNVHCNVCAKDPELFGDGMFMSLKYSLIAGSLPCGCSRSVKWTEDQYRVKVSRKCTEKGYEFLGFNGNYKGSYTRLNLRCKVHDIKWNLATIATLLEGCGCPKCANTGYQQNREISYVYAVKAGDVFAGYGITYDPVKRLKSHERNLKRVGINSIETVSFKTTGEYALKIENEIKANFKQNRQSIKGFKTEATYVENYESLVCFIDKLTIFFHKEDTK